jgi:hypothetical protein
MADLGIVPIQSQGSIVLKGKRTPRKYNFTIHIEVALAFGLSPVPLLPHVLPPARLAEILWAEHQFLTDLLKKKR